MKKLPRLTPALLHHAETKGKTAGWYALCRDGYLPAEISLYADPVITAGDIVTRIRDYANTHDLPTPVSCAPKRQPSTRPAPPEDWRAAFRSSVMRVGLSLHLTQPMLEFLCATADGVMWDRWGQSGSSLARPNNTFASERSLEKRGLIRRKPEPALLDRQERLRHEKDGGSDAFFESYYELTEAGEHLVALLKSVGVFIAADAALRKKETAR